MCGKSSNLGPEIFISRVQVEFWPHCDPILIVKAKTLDNKALRKLHQTVRRSIFFYELGTTEVKS